MQWEKNLPCALACATGHASRTAIFPLLSTSSPLKQAAGARQFSRQDIGELMSSPESDTIFSDTYRRTVYAECEWSVTMPKVRSTTAKKQKHAAIARIPGRPAKPSPKLASRSRRVSTEIGEIVRKRAEAEAAI